MRMKSVIELLPHDKFVRIHKSYIVAIRHIDVVGKDQVRIKKKKIPIGEKFRENLDRFIHKSA